MSFPTLILIAFVEEEEEEEEEEWEEGPKGQATLKHSGGAWPKGV